MTETMFVIVISMWGLTAEDEWTFIGNQYVNNNPMSYEACQAITDDSQWDRHRTNAYYDINIDCWPVTE